MIGRMGRVSGTISLDPEPRPGQAEADPVQGN